MEGIVIGLVGLLLGAAVAVLIARRQARRTLDAALARQREMAAVDKSLLEERLDVQKGAALRAEQELASARGELRELSARHDVASAEAVRLGGANAELTDQLRTARDEGAVSRANA